MRLVPINEAEAILEPFWTGDKNADNSRYSPLDAYEITLRPGVKGSRSPEAWFTIEQAPAGVPVFTLRRRADVRVDEYDASRLCASVPRHVRVTIHGVLDGREHRLLDVQGRDTFSEFTGELPGAHLTALRIELSLTEPRPALVELVWLGLVNRARERLMEARPSPYTPDWPGLLAPDPAAIVPQLNLFFDADEAGRLRRRLAAPPLARLMNDLRAQTDADMAAFNPEAAVGQFLPDPFQAIFVRERDRSKPAMHDAMGRLAFVGLIDHQHDKSRLAVRMALAVAHCRDWTQGILSVLPGSPYHRRAYVEAWYCKGMAQVLDWAGDFLTPAGRETLRDVLIRQGLAHIESDLMRWEYVWSMNQGLMFNHGRLMALLAVHSTYPRYRARLEEAERDHHTMLDNYIKPDGGTLEGMGYWDHALSVALPPLCALARYHGQSLEEYVTPALRRTGEFALDMLSIQEQADGLPRYLPVNSCHSREPVGPFMAAFFARVTGSPAWQAIFRESLDAGGRADQFTAILATDEAAAGAARPAAAPGFNARPQVGQVRRVAEAPGVGLTHFHFCTGPSKGGHSHEDKGSFILETAGEFLATDRGMLNYDHPEHILLIWAGRHNLLCPEDDSGMALHQQTAAIDGARLTCALEREGLFLLASDQAAVWGPGVFDRNIRRVCSPSGNLFVIDDDAAMPTPRAVSFRLNSPLPMERRDGAYWVLGGRASLRVVPLNWVPAAVTLDVDSIDDREQPVRVMRLVAAPAPAHRLLTAIEVVPAGGQPAWVFTAGPSPRAACGPVDMTLKPGADPAIDVTLARRGRATRTARCRTDTWEEPMLG